MSSKKKRKKTVQVNLKYELYGIIILIFSIIALSRQGPVARALTYLFRFLIGSWDWLIPCFFVVMGLFVMIKRKWPASWTPRRAGILMIVLGLLISSHIGLVRQLAPESGYTAGWIISQTWNSMLEGLNYSETGVDILTHNVGGGMLGALLYAALYFLFDNLGASLIEYALFAIGFILITGVSFVEYGGKLRKSFAQSGLNMKRFLIRNHKHRHNKTDPRAIKAARPQSTDQTELPTEPGVKKPSFFQLFLPETNDHDQKASDAPEGDELTNSEETGTQLEEIPQDFEQEEPIPVIRNFQEHLDEPIKPNGMEPAGENENPHATLLKPSAASAYELPPFHLLSKPGHSGKGTKQNDLANARKLEATLESFGVKAKVMEVVHGPAVTRYEIQPDIGVKVSRIVGLTDDIALALAAKDIRMEAPIPGKAAIGIEVPNAEVSVVTMREVMESSAFHESSSKLSLVFGRDISGQPIVDNLARMPHLLVAGATGSGKSVCINGIIVSILYKAKPNEVKFLMVDPKMVELNVYNGIPHLLAPVVTDPRRASLALKKIVQEMEKRYELFSKSGMRNIEGYNALMKGKQEQTLPYIVVIVDELADLMMVAAGEVEDAICRLAQMARAAGIHLIIATQRPSVDVITGVIKANIPSRVAFGVSSQVDSRTILDMAGAEKLLGRGDMLFLPVGASKPIRLQGAFLSDKEVEAVVNFSRSQEQANYQEELVPEVDETVEVADENVDELYDQAVQILLEAKQASISLLQRRMRIGYTRAARLIDMMEAKGIVGPYEGSKPRELLINLEQYRQMNQRISS